MLITFTFATAGRVAFPIVVCAYISLDFIGGYFPVKFRWL